MVFGLTSSQQASRDLVHPELNNCTISIELKLQPFCPVVLKFLYLVEMQAKFLSNPPGMFQKPYSCQLMDGNNVIKLVQVCKLLKFKFVGVFAADNFPLNLSHYNFNLVNASTFQSIRTHWTLIF